MKKTILALLLVVAMIVCFGAFTASAEETGHSAHCECGGNLTGFAKTQHEAEGCAVVENWTPLTQEDLVRGSGVLVQSDRTGSENFDMFSDDYDQGYYYLAEDIELDRAIEIRPEDNITICLNGHKITWKSGAAAKRSVFRVSATLTLCDCVGTGLIESDNTGEAGMIYGLNSYGTADLGFMLKIYGGTYRMTDNNYTNKSGLMQVGNSSSNPGTFKFYGGIIEGGTGYLGGNIQVERAACAMYMYGGIVRNGSAGTAGKTTQNRGGNIYINEGQFYMYGGSVEGGSVAEGGHGADIFQATDGTGKTNACVLDCAVGTLDYANGANRGIQLGKNFSATKVTVNSLTDYGTVVQSGVTDENMGCFEASAEGEYALRYNATIRSANPKTATKHYTCYCGGNGYSLHKSVGHTCSMYTDWIDLNAHLASLAPAAGSKVELKENNKRYYLSADLTIDYYLIFGDASSSTTKAYKIYLDLNGHTLTGASTLDGDTFVRARSQFYLCDSSFNPKAETVEERYSGAIVATANRTYSLMYGSTGARVRIFGGKLYSAFEGTRKGCLIATSCRFDVYDGYINGGKVSAAGSSVSVYDSGELDLFGGLIEGGETTTNGGNIYVDKVGGKLILVSGTVSGGKADKGGNIYVNKGTVEIKGGTVQNGTATGTNALGGNIYVNAGTSVKDDGSINEQYNGKLKMSSGTVKDGTAIYGGNIYVSATSRTTNVGGVKNVYTVPATFTFSGGSIEGGNATYGGSMEIRGQVTMSGGTIDGGHATKEGGNIRLYMTNVNDVDGNNVVFATFTQTGGTIKNGSSDSTGGNMHAYGNVNLTGGSMIDGTAAAQGGNLRLYRPAVANIGSGYTISGGNANYGGNVAIGGATTTSAYSAYSIATISGTITGGSATNEGGNIYSTTDYVRLTLDGVTTSGGTSGTFTPDMYFTGASELTLTGNCNISQLRLNNQTGQTVDASGLTNTTPIPIGCRKYGEFATSTADTSACFVSIQTSEVTYENGKLITTAPNTVHVASSGNDNYLGTEGLPYKTLEHALDVIGDNGTVVILDTVAPEAFEKHDKHITLTGGELVMPKDRVELKDHFTFENMTLTLPHNTESLDYYFYCDGFTTLIDSDVTIRYFDGTNYLTGIKSSAIYGGCRSSYQTTYGNIQGTNLTVLSGTWGHIYGGNNACVLNGDAYLTVGGNVNKDLDYATTGHNSSTNGYNLVYGGSRNANLNGNAYLTVTGGKFNSIYGGSRGAYAVNNIELRIQGGGAMAAYGAGIGGAQTVNTINFYFEGGYCEQVFGGTLSQSLTGDVNMYITGGEISRRLYGGCYNGTSGLSWSTNNSVAGNIRVYIDDGANITCTLDKNDRGIYGHSRRGNASTSDAEHAEILFMTKEAYESHKDKLGMVDGGMLLFSAGKPIADLICYLDWNANEETNVISSNATAVKDPQTNKTGDASEYLETVSMTLANGPFYYNGQAHEPATVTESNWKQGQYELAYTDNTAIGTATVTLTANGYTVSETFEIIKKAEVAQVGGKQYEYLQDAVNAVSEGGFMQILIDCDEDITISKTIYLDLAGHKLTGKVTVAEGATLYGVDSTTDDYNCADGYGEITNVTGNVPTHYKATVNGKVRRYLTYTDPETGAKSFHRLYIGVTSISLRPGASGMGYKATIAGDEKVVEMTDGNVYMKMWVEGNEDKAMTKSTAMNGNRMTISALVKGMDVEKHHNMPLFANVSVKVNGQMITSATTGSTLRQTIEAVATAIAGNTTYTDAQMSALYDLCSAHIELMQDWTNISSILNWTPTA